MDNTILINDLISAQSDQIDLIRAGFNIKKCRRDLMVWSIVLININNAYDKSDDEMREQIRLMNNEILNRL